MSEFKRIAATEAQHLREQGAAVVDIRDPESFARAHISNSQHLDNHSLPDFIRAADLDQPLLVVCYHGNSSQSAAAYLASQGFADVYSLDGGIEAWQANFPNEVSQSLPE
jgi:thiosulfate sulfurtransferase